VSAGDFPGGDFDNWLTTPPDDGEPDLGAVPEREIDDDVSTVDQCQRCLNPIHSCTCETAGARTPRRKP
jgi:hypothetical protein